MASAIQKISKRAKAIRRAHPSKKWMACIKEASREYKAGKLGATLLIEKNETRRTKPKRVVRVTRSKKGTFKSIKRIGNTAGGFSSMAEVKAANKALGHYWFSPSTMKFFKTKIETSLIRGRYFITSEMNFNNTGREYTIREASSNGAINTIGEFQKYKTLKAAKAALQKMLNK